MWATINGHEKTVRFLLSLGLDPNTKREDGKESFQLAREYRQASVLKVLREHGKADSRAPASKH
jgi:ankyrin repeat protein